MGDVVFLGGVWSPDSTFMLLLVAANTTRAPGASSESPPHVNAWAIWRFDVVTSTLRWSDTIPGFTDHLHLTHIWSSDATRVLLRRSDEPMTYVFSLADGSFSALAPPSLDVIGIITVP
jgi:hypothetical protein